MWKGDQRVLWGRQSSLNSCVLGNLGAISVAIQFIALKFYPTLQSVSPKLPSNSSPTWVFCSHQASLQTLLDVPCSFSVSTLTHIDSSKEAFCYPLCPPSVSAQLKSRLRLKTLHYSCLFGLVLTLLVSTTAFSPVLFYSFLWFMYSSLVSTIIDQLLCLFHTLLST